MQKTTSSCTSIGIQGAAHTSPIKSRIQPIQKPSQNLHGSLATSSWDVTGSIWNKRGGETLIERRIRKSLFWMMYYVMVCRKKNILTGEKNQIEEKNYQFHTKALL